MLEPKSAEKLKKRIRQMLATLAPNDFDKQHGILQEMLQETQKGSYYRAKLIRKYPTLWKEDAEESLEELCKELSLELRGYSQLNLFKSCV